MKREIKMVTQFAAHLQFTKGFAAKANITKDLQTNAANSFRVIINCIKNLIRHNPTKQPRQPIQ